MIDERAWRAYASKEGDYNTSMDYNLLIQGLSKQLVPLDLDKIVELLDKIDDALKEMANSDYRYADEYRRGQTGT